MSEETAPAGGSERMSEEDLGRCECLILRDSQAGPDRMETYRMVLAEARRARRAEEGWQIAKDTMIRVAANLGEKCQAKDAEIAALRERAAGTEKRLDRLLRWFRGEGRRRLPGQGDVEDYLVEQAEDLSDRVGKAEADAAALRERAEKAEDYITNVIDKVNAESSRVRADRDRLAALIKDAPHDSWCHRDPDAEIPCDCWKADARGEVK